MEIKTSTYHIDSSAASVFHLLENLENYESLFPQEKIKNWKATEDTCEFLIKGMSMISMKKKDSKPFEQIRIESGVSSPIRFKINIEIKSIDDNTSTVELNLSANVNAFIKMMAEKQLDKFFNEMLLNVKSTLEK